MTDTGEPIRAVYVDGDGTEKLRLAREKVVPNHHHNDALAQEIEAWWHVTSGDALIERYGEDSVRSAHEEMQGYPPEDLDMIQNLGGYFRTVASRVPRTVAPLGRTIPKLKREHDDAREGDAANERYLERKRINEEIPGTVGWRLKHGSAGDGNVDNE